MSIVTEVVMPGGALLLELGARCAGLDSSPLYRVRRSPEARCACHGGGWRRGGKAVPSTAPEDGQRFCETRSCSRILSHGFSDRGILAELATTAHPSVRKEAILEDEAFTLHAILSDWRSWAGRLAADPDDAAAIASALRAIAGRMPRPPKTHKPQRAAGRLHAV